MKTDITLRSSGRTIVADAKYYRNMLTAWQGKPKVRADHLYQLSAYLAHVRANEPSQEVSGLLIYPANGKSVKLQYELLEVPLTVATVDLSANWQHIHAELIALIRPPVVEQ